MTKKKQSSPGPRKLLFNMEVLVMLLLGAVAILGTVVYGLFVERMTLIDQNYQTQMQVSQLNKQVTDLQLKLDAASKAAQITK